MKLSTAVLCWSDDSGLMIELVDFTMPQYPCSTQELIRSSPLLSCGGLCSLHAGDPANSATVFEWRTLGRPIALLGLQAIGFFMLTLLLDWNTRARASTQMQWAARAAARRHVGL